MGFFCLMYPSPHTREVDSMELPMGSDRKTSEDKGSLERQKTFKHKEKLQPHCHLHQAESEGRDYTSTLPRVWCNASIPHQNGTSQRRSSGEQASVTPVASVGWRKEGRKEGGEEKGRHTGSKYRVSLEDKNHSLIS